MDHFRQHSAQLISTYAFVRAKRNGNVCYAVVIAELIELNRLRIEVPMLVTSDKTTTDIRQATRAYSIIVTPRWSARKSRSKRAMNSSYQSPINCHKPGKTQGLLLNYLIFH